MTCLVMQRRTQTSQCTSQLTVRFPRTDPAQCTHTNAFGDPTLLPSHSLLGVAGIENVEHFLFKVLSATVVCCNAVLLGSLQNVSVFLVGKNVRHARLQSVF
eukprot:m.253515 g.253515  ORF g.253515 m.253515 type:complete len:102 (-) comp19134_c0_seq2:1510-1815(-)